MVISGRTTKNKFEEAHNMAYHNGSQKKGLLWPIIIIGTILYFPIAVILELTKKYK